MRYLLAAISLALLGISNISLASNLQDQGCPGVESYKIRVIAGFAYDKKLRTAFIREVKLASFINYSRESIEYAKWDQADTEFEKIDTNLVNNFSIRNIPNFPICYPGNAGVKVSQYLDALSALEIAKNILVSARDALVSNCNDDVSSYAPYLNASDAAFAIAKTKLNPSATEIDDSAEASAYINMKRIKNLCQH